MSSRSCVLVLGTVLVAVPVLTGCRGGDALVIDRFDASLTSAAAYIIARQASSGAFPATAQAEHLDAPAVTSHVLSCVYFLPTPGGPKSEAYRRGQTYLAGLVDDDSRLAEGVRLAYPVYTAAEAGRMAVLPNRSQKNLRTQRGWLGVLGTFQHTEALGWDPTDDDYGGWGTTRLPPMKPGTPGAGGAWSYANLSNTIYGVAAYRSARAPTLETAAGKALIFIQRCQNFSEDASKSDPRFDDGGFFYCRSLPEMNKAGVAGTDASGTERYNSYGSMTADGLRGLLACGLKADHPRVRASRKWLIDHFSVTRHPGRFSAETEWMRDAFYYYYVWALSHALLHLDQRFLDTPRGRVDWPVALGEELIRRQKKDGSWVNLSVEAFEDDPMVATPWAASALSICRFVIAADSPTAGPCTPAKTRKPHP